MGHVYSSSTSSGELIQIVGAQVGIGMNLAGYGIIAMNPTPYLIEFIRKVIR